MCASLTARFPSRIGNTNCCCQTRDSKQRAHSVNFAIPLNYPLVHPVVTSDLPMTSSLEEPTTTISLSEIVSQLRDSIERLQDYFDCMDELDKNLRVLDPEHPARKDTWRRIALMNHCSLQIEIDPARPRDALLRNVRFFGSEKNTEHLRELWQTKISLW